MVFISILLSFAISDSKQLYSTVQMMDQIMILDTESLNIEQSVMTEFGDADNLVDCMSYSTQMECNMNSDCEWSDMGMGMCMENTSSLDCMSYSTQMECNMNSGCEWSTMGMGMCMEGMSSNTVNTPHYIVLDEINGYWFVTTIASGFVAQYSLVDNTLIDAYFVGDAPALLAVDPENKKIYCSRMMPMNGMGNMMPSSESNIIQGLNYNSMGMSESENQTYIINSPAPHGLAINDDGTELYTVSNTADWLYKINTINHEITGVVMDQQIGNTPDQVTQRLKPIQCISVGNRLFVSCSSGTWQDPYSGVQTVIQGSLQMWNSDTMTLLDDIDLGEHTAPWHIKESPVDNVVYVALSGDNLYETEGLACVRYNEELAVDWITNDSSFNILHGVDVSSDGSKIFVSARGDGYIHVFNSNGDYVENVLLGSMSMLGGLAVEQMGNPELGDLNNDLNINVVDIVSCISIIFNSMMNSPYSIYASDLNSDGMTNIFDVILIVEKILQR